MSGPEGIIESTMVEKDSKALQTEAVDCKWFIQAPPGSKVNLPQIILIELQSVYWVHKKSDVGSSLNQSQTGTWGLFDVWFDSGLH